MANLLGVSARSFELQHPEKATEMKRMVMEYVRELHRANMRNTTNQDPGEELVNGIYPGVIMRDDSGFPLAPRPSDWGKVTKQELEILFRIYIAVHYRESFFFVGRTKLKDFND